MAKKLGAASREPSEFGGRPGLVQSEADGHVPTASERRSRLTREADPADIDAPVYDAGERVV